MHKLYKKRGRGTLTLWAVRNAQIKRAETLLEHINPETYKKGPHDITRFIKRISSPKSGLHKDLFEINKDMIAEEEKYDGYYAVAINLDDDVKTIIDISSRRYKREHILHIQNGKKRRKARIHAGLRLFLFLQLLKSGL